MLKPCAFITNMLVTPLQTQTFPKCPYKGVRLCYVAMYVTY